MTTTVRLPNGAEIEVQTDDIKAATAAARKHWSKAQAAATPKPRSALQTAGDFVGDVVDNFLPNWGDEVAAIPDAAAALAKGKPVGAAFERGRREFRQHQVQYDREHPALAWTSTIGGLGASLALPVGRVAKGASMAAKLLHGAAVGAGYGAVAGAGEGDSLGERTNNAATGGLAGAVVGGASAPALSGLAAAGRYARQTVPGADAAARKVLNVPRAVWSKKPLATRETDAQTRAARFMQSRMTEGHVATGFGQQGAPATPETLLAEIERRKALGVPAYLGDTTDAMRSTTSWASRGTGPGQAMVRSAIDARKAGEAMRVRQHVAETLGPVTDTTQQAERMRQDAQAAAAPGYAAAYVAPVEITPQMSAIMQTPAYRDALPNAIRNVQNAQRFPEPLGLMNGNPNTEGFDQVIRAMRDNGEAAMRPGSFPGDRPTNTTNSVHINQRAGDLKAQLAAQNPAYADVTAKFADDMAQRDALVQGTKFADMTGGELTKVGRDVPESAHASWALGARSAMGDAASQFGAKYPTGDTAGRLRQMLGDDTKQAAIGGLTGNTGAVAQLQERLEAEQQGNILWKEVQGNSRTAQRQQADQDLDRAMGFVEIPNMSPIGLMTKAANVLQSGVTKGMRADVKEHVARIVTEADPDKLRSLVHEISNTANRDRDFSDRLHRIGLTGAKAAAVNSEAPDPGKYSSNPGFRPDDGWAGGQY